jgi:cardiolipin synthase C
MSRVTGSGHPPAQTGGCTGGSLAALMLAAALLAGCAAPLPSLETRVPSTHATDTGNTLLGRAAARADAPPDRSGVYALPSPLDAFAARVLLVRAAERALDLQYYIWHADTTGNLLLDEVRRAADRGVRVRLLLDDNGIPGLDRDLAALDAHPNVEVRLFNPFVQRRFKTLGYLTDFQRLNHRMHNKSLTADAQATIVGGRNVGDIYFGADPQAAYADLDVLALGPVAREVARAFDEYWNSGSAYPAVSIIGPPDLPAAQALEALRERLAAAASSEPASAYAGAVQRATLVDRLVAGQLALEWVPTRVVYDPPTKAEQEVGDSDLMLAKLTRDIGIARREADLVSPYFVPGPVGTGVLTRQAALGVQVRIVTNSLAATDVVPVHAGYAKRRKALLRGGVRLYELKPTAPLETASRPAGSPVGLTGSSSGSLHGKTFSLDRNRIFVGSFNLDPRSTRLNTEMGLVIESRALATRLSGGLDRELKGIAYELHLTDDDQIEWVERTADGEVRHRSEPGVGFGRRLGVGFLSILPIEWML